MKHEWQLEDELRGKAAKGRDTAPEGDDDEH